MINPGDAFHLIMREAVRLECYTDRRPEVLKRNRGTIDEESLLGRRCYGGFDLSNREDFTAAALEFPLDDGRTFVKLHSWVPQRKVDLEEMIGRPEQKQEGKE